MKANLGQCREVLSEGDADNRKTRSRRDRRKCISVKHGGGISWRPSENNGKSLRIMAFVCEISWAKAAYSVLVLGMS